MKKSIKLNKLFKFLLFDKKDNKLKIMKNTGKKIPNTLKDTLKAANTENIKKFLKLGFSSALKQ